MFPVYRGVSKLGYGNNVNQNPQSIVEPKHEALLKRDAAADYEDALCTGGKMWVKIQAGFDGHPRDPVQNFQLPALRNGWTRVDLHIALDEPWRKYIDQELGQGKVPPADQTLFVELTQNQNFTNRQGGHRQSLDKTGLAAAKYRAYYIPTISAVVIKNMRSPATVVKEISQKAGQSKPPSNAIIRDVYAPPLSRWSEVTWTVYEDLANSTQHGKLRFIGHDEVNNAVSASVMIYIIRRHQPQGNPNTRPSLPFPGFEFGMETREGQALLGTPNGMGTAWLLYDRGRELGKRNIKVRIWIEGRDKLMMAFNMIPV